jgi:predicted RNA-binding Zn-ribbon protein involved in translation (DUF1610 family)
LQKKRTCGKITTIEDKGKIYLACPKCGKHKVARLYPETVAVRFGVFCKSCGEQTVDIPKLVPVP